MYKLKYLMVGIILLGTSNYLVSESPHYTEGKKSAQCVIPSNQIPEEKISPYGNGSGGEIKWGTDRLIRTGSPALWWRSLSHSADMPNKPSYFAIIRYVSGSDYDTIFHYYSTNGINWTSWFPIFAPGARNEIWQVEVRVGRGTNPWIYTFVLASNYNEPGSHILILRRMKAQGGAFDWITIAQPANPIWSFAVDMDENEILYLAYVEDLGTFRRIYCTRSTDQGMTWETPFNFAQGNVREPEIAIGKDNYFYVAYVLNDTILMIARNTNGLSGNWNYYGVDLDGDEEYQPSIAASRFQTPPNQTAWVLYRHHHRSTNTYDIHYAYTTNGGQNWTYAEWPPTNNMNHGDVGWPWIETCFDYPSDICGGLATTAQTYDSIITAFAGANTPTNWTGRLVINDHNASPSLPNRIDLNVQFAGRAIAYLEHLSGNVWFDFYNNTHIKEFSGNISPDYSIISKNGYAILKFSLPYGKNLKIDIYSSSGENIGRYEKYFGAGKNTFKILLPSQGVYFFKLPERTFKVINIK